MIDGKIREGSRFEFDTVDAVHIDRLRGDLHYEVFYSRIYHYSHMLLQLTAFGGRIERGNILSAKLYSV